MNRAANRIEDSIIGRIDRDRAPKPARACPHEAEATNAFRRLLLNRGRAAAYHWAQAAADQTWAVPNKRPHAAAIALFKTEGEGT